MNLFRTKMSIPRGLLHTCMEHAYILVVRKGATSHPPEKNNRTKMNNKGYEKELRSKRKTKDGNKKYSSYEEDPS